MCWSRLLARLRGQPPARVNTRHALRLPPRASSSHPTPDIHPQAKNAAGKSVLTNAFSSADRELMELVLQHPSAAELDESR